MNKKYKKPLIGGLMLAASILGTSDCANASGIVLGVADASYSVALTASDLFNQSAWMSAFGTSLTSVATQMSSYLSASLPAPVRPQRETAVTGVFGSVPIAFSHLPAAQNWKMVQAHMSISAPEACSAADQRCDRRKARLARVVEEMRGENFREKLSAVNAAVNGMITYASDQSVYGVPDHWATPSETLTHGKGDCEDFALLKMSALLALGVPERSMSIVVLQISDRKVYHAVLSVSTSEGYFILDNLRTYAAKDTSYSDYVPIYSVSAGRSWIHGFKKGNRNLASQSLAIQGAVVPG